MTFLYSCRHSGDEYRISKFDSHFNLESSYLCTSTECDCPAGVRPTCRHRQMLPKFLAREAVGTDWFLDFDRGGWVQGPSEFIDPAEQQSSPEGPAETITLVEVDPAELAKLYSPEDSLELPLTRFEGIELPAPIAATFRRRRV